MITHTEKYRKSCFNYTGGKFKLLPQILPLFPRKMNTFVDLFCGGANVAINASAQNRIVAIDHQKQLIRLFHTLKKGSVEETFATIESIIEDFGLSNTYEFGYEKYACASQDGLAQFNKEKFLQLREFYNERKEDSTYYDIVFYVLTVFGFNNQIRFNKKGDYNIPVGKRDFNRNMRKNLSDFISRLQEKDVQFEQMDFRQFDPASLGEGDFLYADPPYLISTATYNEQNGWTEKEEKDLLDLLDALNNRGVKFALSNVTEHKGCKNEFLLDWVQGNKSYHVNELNFNYKNSNYQIKERTMKTTEVLVTNYIPEPS